jgi:hypothetical protein
MMNESIALPKNPKALAHVIRRHADRCEMQLMYRRTNWLLAWYYLNGYRRFDVFDPVSGQLSPHLLDKEGNMEFQSQDLLFAINQVAGRIQSMDLRLRTETQANSIDGMRSKAMSQIIGDATINENTVERVKEEYAWMFACLGFAGITGHVVDHPTIGLTTDLEVIHPRELFPFPLTGQDVTKMQGIVRQRWMTVKKLEEIYGAKKIKTNLEDMEWFEADPGEPWPERDGIRDVTYWTGSRSDSSTMGSSAEKDEYIGVVKVRELWLLGANNTVSRYVVTSGDVVLQDDDLSSVEAYCPIGWSRFFNNGTFHGAGMFDLLFSTHRNLERLSKALFNNVMDLDRYGVLVLPQGQMNQNQILRDVGRGLRVMFWQPDALVEGFKPFSITPHNAGDMPGRVAQFAREAMNAVNPIQDLIKEKGRVDSASGLQFLEEQMTRTLTTPTNGVVRAWGDMYRSLIQTVTSKLTMSRRALPVGALTLDLAGAVIDPESLTVSFTNNPLPDLARVNFSIRALTPKSTVARKQEALELWQRGVNKDPVAFNLFAIKEGLDFAMWMDEDKAAYEMAVRAILMVYGDGREPGKMILTPHTTKPDIVLRVLNSFVTGPAMSVASASVHNAMKQFRSTLINFMGLSLPAAVPNPDDAAMLSQMSMQQGPQPGMVPGMMPPNPGVMNAIPQ